MGLLGVLLGYSPMWGFLLKNLVFVQSHWAFIFGRFQSGVGMKSIICGMWEFRSRNNLLTVQIALWGPAIWIFFMKNWEIPRSFVSEYTYEHVKCSLRGSLLTIFYFWQFGSRSFLSQLMAHFFDTGGGGTLDNFCIFLNCQFWQFGSHFGSKFTTNWTFLTNSWRILWLLRSWTRLFFHVWKLTFLAV